jgi:two-component system, LytTR family, response regulator
MSVIAECENAIELQALLSTQAVDLIFLDIEIQDTNGFDLLKKIQPPIPQIVFVTAYSEFAAKAFDVEALDYLVKPFTPERFRLALDKARKKIFTLEPSQISSKFIQSLAVRIGRNTRLIETNEIDFIHSQANYIEVHAGPHSYSLRQPISWIQEQLDPKKFIRVHRSYIVKINCIKSITHLSSGKYSLLLNNGKSIQCGRTYKMKLKEVIHI